MSRADETRGLFGFPKLNPDDHHDSDVNDLYISYNGEMCVCLSVCLSVCHVFSYFLKERKNWKYLLIFFLNLVFKFSFEFLLKKN